MVGASRGWVVTVDDQATRYTVDLGDSSLRLPIRGRMSDFTVGHSQVPTRDEITDGTLPDPRTFRFRIPR